MGVNDGQAASCRVAPEGGGSCCRREHAPRDGGRFKVSVRSVNGMVKLKAGTGGLVPKPQGNGGGHGKLAALKGWLARRIGKKRDLTAAALAAEIAATHGAAVHRGTVWQALRNSG